MTKAIRISLMVAILSVISLVATADLLSRTPGGLDDQAISRKSSRIVNGLHSRGLLTPAEKPLLGAVVSREGRAAPMSVGKKEAVTLTSGVPVTFTLPLVSSNILFCGDYSHLITVPSGAPQLEVKLTTLTPGADVDLYVRRGQDVALSGTSVVADYKATTTSGNELITISSPPAGIYYIAFGVFTHNVSITCTITATVGTPTSSGGTLTSGIPDTFTLPPVTSNTLFHGDYSYKISVPTSATELLVELTTATPNADVDLYVRQGQDVGLSGTSVVADYKAATQTGNETIAITTPQAGDYYIAFGVFTPGIAVTCTIKATYVTRVTVLPKNSLIVPQFVGGGGWTTALYLTNNSDLSEDYIVQFYTSGGFARSANIEGLGPVNVITAKLSAGQTVVYQTNSYGTMDEGWAAVIPNIPVNSRLTGFAIFRYGQGALGSEAVVTLGSTTDQSLVMLYDEMNGYSTGLALVNPGATAITLSVAVRDQSGAQIGADNITLPAFSQLTNYLYQNYKYVFNKRGSIQIKGSPGFAALGLRFSPSGQFSSFPALK